MKLRNEIIPSNTEYLQNTPVYFSAAVSKFRVRAAVAQWESGCFLTERLSVVWTNDFI